MSEIQPDMNGAQPWPKSIRVSADRRTLNIGFDTGDEFAIAAELLRVTSPSAEVQGHSAAERKLVPGKRNVAIRDVVATGNYAIRIVFDDGHDTGIFTWAFLLDAGRGQAGKMSAYDAELSAKGLSR